MKISVCCGAKQWQEIEFVCTNSNFPSATSSKQQELLYHDLTKIPGVVPLWQDWTHYEQTDDYQRSLTALFVRTNHTARASIVDAAAKHGVEIDLEQPVSAAYVKKAQAGTHEGQLRP